MPLAHPDVLHRTGALHGLQPAPPERARILELGCGEGANLLPIAYHLPQAEVVGVEPGALDRASEGAAQLGLDRVQLLGSTADLEGRFDYVLVPELLLRPGAEVATVLTELAGRLEPHGLAFLAHAMPAGRALREEVASALCASALEARDLGEALTSARRALHAMAAHLPEDPHPYARLLALELGRAMESDDDALLRDYLLPPPEALRRGELEARASDAGLKVVAELGPTTADPRAGEALRRALAAHGEPFAIETWADLLQGRDVRWLVLAPHDAPTREASDPQLNVGRLACALLPADPDPWLGPRAPLAFVGPDGYERVVEHPAEKAALLTLAEAWPATLAFGELVEDAALRLRASPSGAALDPEGAHRIAMLLMELGRHRVLRVTSRAIRRPASLPAAPRVSALSRWEAERGALLTTPYHDVVPLDPIERLIVQHFDGRSLNDVATELHALVDEGTLAFFDGPEPWPRHVVLRTLDERLGPLSHRLARAALLE
jgi:SAM-dependent methyltransferase